MDQFVLTKRQLNDLIEVGFDLDFINWTGPEGVNFMDGNFPRCPRCGRASANEDICQNCDELHADTPVIMTYAQLEAIMTEARNCTNELGLKAFLHSLRFDVAYGVARKC